MKGKEDLTCEWSYFEMSIHVICVYVCSSFWVWMKGSCMLLLLAAYYVMMKLQFTMMLLMLIVVPSFDLGSMMAWIQLSMFPL